MPLGKGPNVGFLVILVGKAKNQRIYSRPFVSPLGILARSLLGLSTFLIMLTRAMELAKV
jgi:hypothetical protein